MIRDGFLNLPSESGFDYEFPAYITEVAADDGWVMWHLDGVGSLTYYTQAPYTERPSVSIVEGRTVVCFLTAIW